MPWLFHSGMEDQVLPGYFPTDADQTPVISSANPNSGLYHVRIPYASNDIYTISSDNDFSAASSGASRLMGAALCFDGDVNLIRFGIVVDTTASTAYAGFSINADTGVVTVGAANDPNLGDQILYTSAAGVFVPGDYIDLEVYWVPDNTTGAWAFAINGVEVYSDSGADTYPTTGSPNAEFGLLLYGQGDTTGSANLDIDDFRVGESLSGLQGRMEHEWCAIDSAIESDGVGSDGNSVDNHLLVDETPFSATDYVDLQAALDRERYGLANRTLTGDIASVSIVCQAQQPSGSSTANTFLESNTTEEAGGDLTLGAGSTVFRQYVEQDPDTAAAWTTSGFNAATIGMERTA